MEPPSLSNLPADIRLRYLHKSLTAESLLALCSTSKEYAQLCQNKNVWIEIIQRELRPNPQSLQTALDLFPNMSGKDLYTLMELRTYVRENAPNNILPAEEDILQELLNGPPIRAIRRVVPLEQIYFVRGSPKYEFSLPNGMTLRLQYALQGYAQINREKVSALIKIGHISHFGYIILDIPVSLVPTVVPILIRNASQIRELPSDLLERYQTIIDVLKPIRDLLNLPNRQPTLHDNMASSTSVSGANMLRIDVQV